MHPSNQHYRSGQPSIKICEAVDCYEAATETIIVSAGKFGTIELNLCHNCAVTRFQTIVRTNESQMRLQAANDDTRNFPIKSDTS